MPELKHTFTSGRMNKDLDERLVPNGEYRDAWNVEVLTSEGSNIGTVQTCLGNSLISDLAPDDASSCVGAVVDDKTNNVYYFITGNTPPPVPTVTHTISSDLVVEYNSVSGETLPVIVDIYNVQTRIRREIGANWACQNRGVCGNYVYAIKTDATGLRVGMEVNVELVGHPTWVQSFDKPIITAHDSRYIATDSRIRDSAGVELTNAVMGTAWEAHQYPAHVNFSTPRVLNFHRDKLITGVNIVDDMLFWCDGVGDDTSRTKGTEPKKVNITRGKQGSIHDLGLCINCNIFQNPVNGTTHTELIVEEENAMNRDGILPYIQEKHITVIKKAPLTPPKLEMYDSINRFDITSGSRTTPHNIYALDQNQRWWGNDPKNPGSRILAPVGMTSTEWNTVNVNTGGTIGDERIGYFKYANRADYRVGDVLLCTDNQSAAIDPNTSENLPFDGDDVRIKLQVIESDSTNTNPTLVNSPNNGNLQVKILYIDTLIPDTKKNWYIRLEDKTESLYELKFPKFAYRYKYEDGEYSAFSPFSEIAFLPQEFDYHPKKGYNKGMTNGLKQLFVKDFIPPNIPRDVVEIDILYKESDSPNIYTIRSFKDVDPEWNRNGTGNYKGYFEIKDDLIHAVVPSNQLLRPWDNVPKKALAQEVTGNRLIYGNYIQNYNLESSTDQGVKPEFKTTVESNLVDTVHFPETSLKSMRTYQLGIVYKDVYGRETPVITHPSGAIKLDASKSIFNSKFTVQAITPPPFWADSFKYFVKEISNEYYNLAMDRWYDADDPSYDGERVSIWMSFASEDRNKVDEEVTLILKKAEIDLDSSSSASGFIETTPRKKILAIENEAPDFIKTTLESIGTFTAVTATQGSAASPSDEGYFYNATTSSGTIYLGVPWVNGKQIRIQGAQWIASSFASLQNKENTILNGDISNRNSSLVMRFIGDASNPTITSWYNIANIAHVNTDSDGHYVINIDGYFKDELAYFVGTGNDYNDIIPNITVEIAKKTVENRPEFDGRFFVKVESDPELKKVLALSGNSTTTTNWATTSVMNSYFLYGAANASTPYCFSKYEPATGLTSGWEMSVYPNYHDPANGITGIHTTYWSGGTYAPADRVLTHSYHRCSNAGSGLQGYFDYCYPAGQFGGTSNPFGSSGQGHLDPPYRVMADWENLMDANSGDDTFWFIDSEPGLVKRNVTVQQSVAQGFKMAGHGKGADIGEHIIDISIAGIDKSNSYGGASVRGADPSAWSPANKTIHNKLSTPGTRFRFANDPDKLVYEIYSVTEHHIWNYDDPNHISNTFISSGVYQGYKNSRRRRYRLTLIEPFSANPGQTLTYKGIGDGHSGTPYVPCNYNDIEPSFSSNGNASEKTSIMIQFVEPDIDHQEPEFSPNPAIWETEPKEDVGLDIYYEIGQNYPVNMCDGTEELYIQPGATVSMYNSNVDGFYSDNGWVDANTINTGGPNPTTSHAPGTLTTILPGTHTTTTGNQFTYTGRQRYQDNVVVGPFFAYGNNKILIDAPINPNIVSGLTITGGPPGYIPPGTTIANVQVTAGNQQLLTLSVPPASLPVPGFFSVTPGMGPGTVFTFASANFVPVITIITPTVVSSITGCMGDTPIGSTQPSTLLEFNNGQVLNEDDVLLFTNPDGTVVTATVAFNSPTDSSSGQNQIYLNALVHGERQTLPYYNCYTYGNGVESNRIRDLFNAVIIDKGVKASTTLAEQYKEEDRKSGLIFSGIYNSMNGVNRLNQFIMAENITKDLNPTYGSIQKLHTRDTDLVTLCEDKVLKVLSNKDALYNADDTKNITATSNVLGNSIPFVGDHGISKNPESFASEAFRSYFTDKQRGAVLRLSRDGLTPISDAGMKDWFADNLKNANKIIGNYDSRKSLYNITLTDLPITEQGLGGGGVPYARLSGPSGGGDTFRGGGGTIIEEEELVVVGARTSYIPIAPTTPQDVTDTAPSGERGDTGSGDEGY